MCSDFFTLFVSAFGVQIRLLPSYADAGAELMLPAVRVFLCSCPTTAVFNRESFFRRVSEFRRCPVSSGTTFQVGVAASSSGNL